MGVDDYFSVDDVKNMIKDKSGQSPYSVVVRKHLLKLFDFGYLDAKLENGYKNISYVFRIKKKYCDDIMKEIEEQSFMPSY